MSEGHVTSVAFSPDGKTLAAGYGGGGGRRGAVGCSTREAVSGYRTSRSP